MCSASEELYEREEEGGEKNREIEERDRAIAKMSDMDLLDTSRRDERRSLLVDKVLLLLDRPLDYALKSVDPHVFAGLPLDIQREVIAPEETLSQQDPPRRDTSPSPTMSDRQVQCPYCKAIIPLKKDANYVSCPDCRQAVAAPKSSSTAQRRVVCGHCSAAMHIPADAKRPYVPAAGRWSI